MTNLGSFRQAITEPGAQNHLGIGDDPFSEYLVRKSSRTVRYFLVLMLGLSTLTDVAIENHHHLAVTTHRQC